MFCLRLSLLLEASVKANKNPFTTISRPESTHIAKVTLKKPISHTKTKAEITALLAQKVLERGGGYREAGHCGVGDRVQSNTQ